MSSPKCALVFVFLIFCYLPGQAFQTTSGWQSSTVFQTKASSSFFNSHRAVPAFPKPMTLATSDNESEGEASESEETMAEVPSSPEALRQVSAMLDKELSESRKSELEQLALLSELRQKIVKAGEEESAATAEFVGVVVQLNNQIAKFETQLDKDEAKLKNHDSGNEILSSDELEKVKTRQSKNLKEYLDLKECKVMADQRAKSQARKMQKISDALSELPEIEVSSTDYSYEQIVGFKQIAADALATIFGIKDDTPKVPQTPSRWGALAPRGYAWKQTSNFLEIRVGVPKGTLKPDVAVELGLRRVRVAVPAAEAYAGFELDDELSGSISLDGSYWYLDDDAEEEGERSLKIFLEKKKPKKLWQKAFTSEQQ
mmetsp:Transcript_34899/g.54904  ORF Transcript_34899/g.54904 Transcript_34899/m.54904 type:complete len:372 (-) Transcript_34899:649-1764(-)